MRSNFGGLLLEQTGGTIQRPSQLTSVVIFFGSKNDKAKLVPYSSSSSPLSNLLRQRAFEVIHPTHRTAQKQPRAQRTLGQGLRCWTAAPCADEDMGARHSHAWNTASHALTCSVACANMTLMQLGPMKLSSRARMDEACVRPERQALLHDKLLTWPDAWPCKALATGRIV